MAGEITCSFVDNVWVKLESTPEHLLDAVSNYMTFPIPNWEMIKRMNRKLWWSDGKIRLFKRKKKLLPYGSLTALYEFCTKNKVKLTLDAKIKANTNHSVTEESILDFIDTLGLPYDLRDYQESSVLKAIRNKRQTVLISTGGGKSLCIYLITKWILDNDLKDGERILVVVPNRGLLQQLKNNFEEYGYKGDDVKLIKAGESKVLDKKIVFSTWQSIYKEPKEFFKSFKCFMFDECFRGDQNVLMGDMTKKRIDDVSIGDVVMSYNEKTKSFSGNKVTNTFKNLKKSESCDTLLSITFENGENIICTPNHKILTNRGYIEAQYLVMEMDKDPNLLVCEYTK